LFYFFNTTILLLHRKFHGPHICGDALDIDPVHNHILTGSWRKTAVLQIWDFAMAVKIKDVPQDSITSSQVTSFFYSPVFTCMATG
jgi:hypothetical protein